MKGLERRDGEGKVEYLARLGIMKNLGVAAVAAAGAVLIPPLGAPLAAAALFEGLHGGALMAAHGHLKSRRLKKSQG